MGWYVFHDSNHTNYPIMGRWGCWFSMDGEPLFDGAIRDGMPVPIDDLHEAEMRAADSKEYRVVSAEKLQEEILYCRLLRQVE